MKKLTVMMTLLLGLQASDQGGFYQTIPYRGNDPFLFCTDGQDLQKNPDRCWMPLPPYTGNWMTMPYCQPINSYGIPWDSDDIASLGYYQSVCPNAEQSGRWNGSRPANMVPFKH